MMRLVHALFQALLLLGVVFSNALTDGKDNAMLNSYYGPMDFLQVVGSDFAVAKAAGGDVMGMTLGNPNDFKWRISAQSDTDILHTCHKSLYTYSRTSSTIFHHNASSGVYHGRSDLSSAVLLIDCFHDVGVLVHTIDGCISYIDSTTMKLTLVQDNARLIMVTETPLGMRLLVNGIDLVDLGPEGMPTKVLRAGFGNDTISSVQGPYVRSAVGNLWQLDTHEESSVSEILGFSEEMVLLPELIYSTKNNQLTLYRVDGLKVETATEFKYPSSINNVTYHQYGLTTILAVRFDSDRWDLLDLTEFLILGNSKAIRRTRVKSHHRLLFVTTDDLLELFFITLSDDATGLRFRLKDGSLQSVIGYPNPHTISGPSLLIETPIPGDALEEQNRIKHDYYTGSFLGNWLRRYVLHASQLRSFLERLILKGGPSLYSQTDSKGLHKLIVSWDEIKRELVASSAADGSVFWSTPLNFTTLRDIVENDKNITGLFDATLITINSIDGKVMETGKAPSVTSLRALKSGECVLREQNLSKLAEPALEDLYFIDREDGLVVGSIIQRGQTESVETWKFAVENSTMLKLSTRQDSTLTGSVGIPLLDKTVLFKYLNPNIAALWARDATSRLVLYLVDGITGSLLYTQTHFDEVVDFSSITATMNDNWLVYSYYIKSPKVELRITVIDMFDTREKWQAYSPQTSSFDFNATINGVFSQSYVFPGRIANMALTISLYGITAKSILVVTSSGEFLEMPKQILDARRAQKKDSSSNLESFPQYMPVITSKDYKVISQDKILNVAGGGQILVKPTSFESSMIVCWVNHNNQYCTVSQPSMSFDLLSASFDKFKLVLTIGALLIAYVITKPFVARRKLNDRWIDR